MAGLILDKQATGVNTPDTQNIMLTVMIALLPGTALYAYFISPAVIANIIVAIVAALLIEAVAVRLRKSSAALAMQDGSICVAAFLLALAVPPALPFWHLLVGIFIMVMLGKHVYGGLGHNPFNPAMVGYAALLVSFPQTMTLWFTPGELEHVSTLTLLQAKLGSGSAFSNTALMWDGVTQATPLEHVRSQRIQALSTSAVEIREHVIQSGWVWVNAGFLLGGCYLLFRKIIQWHIPVSVISSFIIMSLLFSSNSMPIHYALFSGAMMLGAFFIATDPVTTASSKSGRIFFGMGVGSLTLIIREFGGYPEGIAFAILLMNLCTPLIDHVTMRMGRA